MASAKNSHDAGPRGSPPATEYKLPIFDYRLPIGTSRTSSFEFPVSSFEFRASKVREGGRKKKKFANEATKLLKTKESRTKRPRKSGHFGLSIGHFGSTR
jgi:hypothetical protein